jgi:hypothetical protein
LATLADALAAVAARMKSEEAAGAAAKAAALLTKAMTKRLDPDPNNPNISPAMRAALAQQWPWPSARELRELALGLGAVAARMRPEEAAGAAAKAAALLTQAMTELTDVGANSGLAELALEMGDRSRELRELALAWDSMAAFMESKEVARAAAKVAALLNKAMTKMTGPIGLETRPIGLTYLAEGLAAVADRMEPTERASAAAESGALLTQAMTRTADPEVLAQLAQGLAAVAARMEPKKAARAAALLTQGMTNGTGSFHWPELATRIEPKEAYLPPPAFAPPPTPLTVGLAPLFHNKRPSFHNERRRDGSTKTQMMTPYPLLLARLENPDLAELLKQPLCVGDTRHLVLDELGKRYQRRFVDQWDFVRFAKEQNLGFKLAGPPKARQTTDLTFP